MKKFFTASFLFLSSFAWAGPGAVADVKLSPAGSFSGKTDEVKGEAYLTGDTVRAENIVVKLKNLKTGIELRDKHTTEKYLEVEKYPEAILVSAIGKDGKGKGKLKIKGIEKDVEGTYKIEGNELMADFPVKLSEYGIKGIKYMGVGVNDEVKLHIIVPVKKK